MLKNGLLTVARPSCGLKPLWPSPIACKSAVSAGAISSLASGQSVSIAGPSSQLGSRGLHTSPRAQSGGRKPKRPVPSWKTRGSSRTKLAKYVAPAKPFTGKGAFASPYSRAPSVDPANKELSATELYMRARADAVKGRVGGSVYRTTEWNEEVKTKPRPYGLAGDVRNEPPRRSRYQAHRGEDEDDRQAKSRPRPYGLPGDVVKDSTRHPERLRASQRHDDYEDRNGDLVSARERSDLADKRRVTREDDHEEWLSRKAWLAQRRQAPPEPAEPTAEDESAAPAAATADGQDRPPPPTYQPPKKRLPREFTHTPLVRPPSFDAAGLPTSFSTPPLMPGLASSVAEILGEDAAPTAIQQLSLSRLIRPSYTSQEEFDDAADSWTQTLLASETGSGKTLAYMLPLLHSLKHAETHPRPVPPHEHRNFPMMPRALVLAPTHELARQLAGAAKKLSHNIKLRVVCGSRENKPSSGGPGSRLRDLKLLGPQREQNGEQSDAEFTITRESAAALGLGVTPHNRPIDVLTATPSHILELVRGNGWERSGEIVRDPANPRDPGRPWEVNPPTMGLDKVEWVCVDEADVLLDPDFREHTLGILDEITRARSHFLSPSSPKSALPFHLLLNSATIPGLLSATIDERWPGMLRLASPGVHRLPAGMKTEHVPATGNRMADVAARIKAIWAADGKRAVQSAVDKQRANYGLRVLGGGARSKVLVFVNKGSKAAELADYLSGKGIANVVLTGTHGRAHGSNRHLAPFLNPAAMRKPVPLAEGDDGKDVLVTTSLLSRGLDFAPDVRHVLIVDEPRNVVDLLHRAGRSARAGRSGTVTVFGKGAKGAKQVGKAVRGLEA